jgi:hypothetical protein
MDATADIAVVPAPGVKYDRSDSFDFRHVWVTEKSAFLVYFLHSVITDDSGTTNGHWLESAILRRSGITWLVAVLRSTKTAARPGA